MAKKAANKVKRVTRLFTGSDGESHFEDIEVPLKELGDGVRQSKHLKVKSLIFRDTDGDHESAWHNAPRRQFVISLEGALEIEIGDGTKRRFGPGDILLAEDTTGRGHIARNVNKQPRKGISIPLA